MEAENLNKENSGLATQARLQALDKQRLLLLVMPVFALPVLALAFWLFGGGQPEVAQAQQAVGFNYDLPAEKKQELDRQAAYEQAARDSAAAQQEREAQGLARRQDSIRSDQTSAPAQEAIDHYAQINEQLNQMEEARARERREPVGGGGSYTEGSVGHRQELDPQSKALMELSQKYLEKQLGVEPEKNKPEPEALRRQVVVVKPRAKNSVVSSLSGEVTQDGFYTVGSDQPQQEFSGIRAVVHGDQKVVSGEVVKLRLLTDIEVGGKAVPSGSFLSAVASVFGERLQLEISSVAVGQQVLPVALQVYDLDGLAGLYVPGSVGQQAGRQVLSDVVQGTGRGTQITMPRDGKQMLVMEGLNSALNAGKTIISRKVSGTMVRVYLPAGYQVILVADTN